VNIRLLIAATVGGVRLIDNLDPWAHSADRMPPLMFSAPSAKGIS
jgi:hypothetical protein